MNGIATSSSWAILALASLAQTERRVLVRDLAASLGAPRPYLSQIIHRLSSAGLVDAKRGKGGGVALAVPASELTLATVVDVVEGTNWLEGCLMGLAKCSDERSCPAHEFWAVERKRIRGLMERLTISAVATFEQRQGRSFTLPDDVSVDRSAKSARSPTDRRSQ